MGQIMTKILTVAICFLITACAHSRDPVPTSMKTPGDYDMACHQIATEYKANTSAATSKISKNDSDDGQDILLGLFIWPGLADFKNADGTEGNALLDRNGYLLALANEKSCDSSLWPSQPTRYD